MANTAILVPSARRGGVAAYVVRFTWNANPEPAVTGYWLYPSRVSGSWTVPPTNMGDATTGTYEIARPSGLGVWYFSLTAYTPTTESAHSTQVSINIT